MRFVTLVGTMVVAGGAVACSGAGHAPPPAPPAAAVAPAVPLVVDLMPAFWTFWTRAEGVTAPERVALLKELALAPHQEYYEGVPYIPSDERLAKFLDTLTPAIPALRRIDGEFRAQLPGAYTAFLAAYPGLDPALPIYVGPSLFTSSGQVREFNGRTIVMYGLDVMAVVLADVEDHVPDIQHELFHAYHWQRNPGIAAAGREAFVATRTTPMFYDLWIEGLALHAVHRLDPEAPLALLLASTALPEKGPVVLARVAGELRRRLDVTNIDEVGDYFFFHTSRTDIPSRIAYYVGLRLAEEIGRRLSMEQMIALDGDDLRREVEAGLLALESREAGAAPAATGLRSRLPPRRAARARLPLSPRGRRSPCRAPRPGR